MRSRFRYVAPAGAPIRVSDLARWARLVAGRKDVDGLLRQEVCGRFGVGHSFLTSTGRAGLTSLLRALRRLAPAERDEVILPSYTCFSVAASIVKAGLRPRLADVSPETLDYAPGELERADYTRVLAILATNLYGLPNDLPAISDIARRRGVFLIDDAAQAMGASVGGRPCGTWGDAGLYSLDKGKNVSAIDGGIVVTSSDRIASAFAREAAGIRAPGFSDSAAAVVKLLAYFTFLRPSLYWIPASIPQLGLGRTVYTTDFPITSPCRPLVALGVVMVHRVGEYGRTRAAHASAFLKGLDGVPGVQTICPLPGSAPAYLRLPFLAADAQARTRLLDSLTAGGIGATGSYPSSIADIPQLQGILANPGARVDGGRHIAQRIVTLPTHAFVGREDIERALEIVVRNAGGRTGRRASPLAARLPGGIDETRGTHAGARSIL